MEISVILKELRTEKGLTQGELAKCLGISQDSISLWEKGKRVPDTQYVIQFADFFNVSTDYLLGRTDELGGAILPSPANDLSSEERKLVEDYRGLGKPLKDLLQSMIRTWQSDELPASSLSPRKKA